MGAVAHERIVSDPAIMGGKPTVKGTPITVEPILEEPADGMTVAAIRKAHPHLSETDVRVALGFAADNRRRDEIIFGKPATAARDVSPTRISTRALSSCHATLGMTAWKSEGARGQRRRGCAGAGWALWPGAPDPWGFGELIIAVAQDVADIRDAASGDVGTRRLQLGRDVARRLRDDLQRALDRAAEHAVADAPATAVGNERADQVDLGQDMVAGVARRETSEAAYIAFMRERFAAATG